MSGYSVARSFSPANACRPVQTGQPVPRVVLEYTAARHEWPFGQRHKMSLWLPVVTSCGVRGVFFSTSHSAVSNGNCFTKPPCLGVTLRPVQ